MGQIIDDLLAEEGSLIKGPYVSLKLPFVSGSNPRYFPDVPLGFTPHLHQEKAFERLGGRRKLSTLVATGITRGEPPELKVCETFTDEVETITDWLTGVELSKACLVARTNKLVERYAEALEDRDVATRKVHRSAPDDPNEPGLRVATMHRVKGLEFNTMVIAGVTDDMMPLKEKVTRSRDQVVRREVRLMERALLYVSLTRARKAALMTAHGKVSAWVIKTRTARRAPLKKQ